ncbi:TetR/AcrR family transcriptional regulator [Olsenella profusa]|uniref:TetR/AcrR family transcriptional regulator n=1 Tax=Olsenella profusa TaxID=138595 RepID=A0ABS2F143_9ACTN|nr:TetR/AcrR family transcriptional regulator [Olsenella profusa]MBM6774243.1 TetR/AcrR family transcriptional regulator [Olsenella profusa]
MRERSTDRMKVRLADALWACLAQTPLGDLSVGDVIDAAGVSRGSFYYHFSDLDHLTAWAVREELLDSDRRGNSFLVLAACEPEPNLEPRVERSIERICLLLDRGGMSAVYGVALDVTLGLWERALCPEGGSLPDEVVAQIEYSVGGTVGMLSRAGVSTDAKRRVSVAFIHERHLWTVRRVSEVLGRSPRELVGCLEGAVA